MSLTLLGGFLSGGIHVSYTVIEEWFLKVRWKERPPKDV